MNYCFFPNQALEEKSNTGDVMITEMLNHKPICVESIYNSALEGDFYSSILGSVSKAWPDAVVLIFGQDTVKLSGHFLLCRGVDTELGRAYLTDLASHHTWFNRQWHQDIGVVYHLRELVNSDELATSQVYSKIQARAVGPTVGVGVVLSRNGTRQVALEVHTLKGKNYDAGAALSEDLKLLASHLIFGARILELRQSEHNLSQMVNRFLELMSFPSVVINSNFYVLNRNSRALAMFDQNGWLTIGPDGYLCALDSAVDSRLKAMIAKLSTNIHQRGAIMAAPSADPDSRHVITLGKLGGEEAMRGPLSGGVNSVNRVDSCFVLIVQSMTEPLQLTQDALRQTYGLTACECDLATALLDGKTVGDVAVLNKLSKQTLRNRLSTIMRKTQTTKQSELVALLTRMAMWT